MDKELKKIYCILLNGRGYKDGSAVANDSSECVEVCLKWTMTPTSFATAMLYHHYPERCSRKEVVRLEKVCQGRKE
jgi:hypothetical protein